MGSFTEKPLQGYGDLKRLSVVSGHLGVTTLCSEDIDVSDPQAKHIRLFDLGHSSLPLSCVSPNTKK